MIEKITNWWLGIKTKLQLWARKKSYKQALLHAQKEHDETKKKMFIILYKGEFKAFSKQGIKDLYHAGLIKYEAFKRIEQIAVTIIG